MGGRSESGKGEKGILGRGREGWVTGEVREESGRKSGRRGSFDYGEVGKGPGGERCRTF